MVVAAPVDAAAHQNARRKNKHLALRMRSCDRTVGCQRALASIVDSRLARCRRARCRRAGRCTLRRGHDSTITISRRRPLVSTTRRSGDCERRRVGCETSRAQPLPTGCSRHADRRSHRASIAARAQLSSSCASCRGVVSTMNGDDERRRRATTSGGRAGGRDVASRHVVSAQVSRSIVARRPIKRTTIVVAATRRRPNFHFASRHRLFTPAD